MKWPAKIVITIEKQDKATEDAPANNADSVAPRVVPRLPSPTPDCDARWPHDGNHGYL